MISLDNLGDLRHVIDRIGLPPRLAFIVGELEKRQPIDKLKPEADAEVRQVLQLVAGPVLLAVIVAHLIGEIPDEALPQPEPVEPEPDDDDESLDNEALREDREIFEREQTLIDPASLPPAINDERTHGEASAVDDEDLTKPPLEGGTVVSTDPPAPTEQA